LARRDVHFHQRLQGGARLGVPPLRVVLRRIGSEGTVPASIYLRVLACSSRLGQAYGEGEAATGLRDWAII
jgi:hypothetical protein